MRKIKKFFDREQNLLIHIIAKDVAAAAVVISAFTALCVGLYVFLPRFINLFAN